VRNIQSRNLPQGLGAISIFARKQLTTHWSRGSQPLVRESGMGSFSGVKMGGAWG